MSISLIFPFESDADYTFDSSKIELVGGKAKLKLQNNPSQTFNQSFASSSGFTYDNTKAEFVGGLLRQKDCRPANASCGATYTNDINFNWGNGVLTGTAFGGASVSGGKLDLRGATKRVRYDGVGNADCTQIGCVRFKYTPNYTGNPVADRCLFALLESLGSSQSLIQLVHQTSGRINIFVTSSTGVTIINSSSDIISLVSGTEYELEFDWDLTSGQTNLFLNGNKIITTLTSTGSRNSSAYIYIGATFGIGSLADGYFNDFEIFSTVQHTANYTSGYTVTETIYITNKVDCPVFIYSGVGDIQVLTNIIDTEINSPRLIMNGNYWTGSAWMASAGTWAQSNSIATILTNIATCPVANSFVVSVIFNDDNNQQSIDDLTLTYTGQIYLTTNPTIEGNASWLNEGIDRFVETSTISGSDEIKYILKKGTSWYYWSGTAWAVSNETYTQANTAAEIETNKATFTTSRITSKFKAFLHSANSFTTPQLDTLQVDYNYAGETEDTINTCIVWGYLRNFDTVYSDKTVTIALNKTNAKYKTKTMISQKEKTVTVDSTGYWEAEIIETVNMEAGTYYIFKIDGNFYLRYVPNEISKNFYDLVSA